MDHKILLIFFALTALAPMHNGYSQGDYTVRNLSYLYNGESEVAFQKQCYFDENRIYITGEVDINEPRTRISDLFFQYGFMSEYDQDMIFSPDTLRMDSIWVGSRGAKHYIKLSIVKPEEYSYLVIKIYNNLTNTDYLYDIPIPQDDTEYNPVIVAKNAKTGFDDLNPFLREKRSFTFSSIQQDINTLSGFAYFDGFNIARPPMAPPDDAVSKDITIDSVFSVSGSDPIEFSKEGLYFFQTDTSKLTGTAWRVVHPYFPKTVKMEQLVEVMTYITSDNEKSKILNASDQKKEFDTFWLDNTKSSSRAGNAIRLFFQRVRNANEIFSTYKEGWKTDKGMIYIVYGPPDEVYKRKNDQEEWVYNRTSQLPAISFNFYRINSIFSNNHYVLLRRKSYQTVWFQAVDNWRKGQIE